MTSTADGDSHAHDLLSASVTCSLEATALHVLNADPPTLVKLWLAEDKKTGGLLMHKHPQSVAWR